MDMQKYLSFIESEGKEKFGLFYSELLSCNKKFNLTAVTDEKGVFYKHFLDSLAGESLFPLNAKAIEIGSGGGFPSIPLKIMRGDIDFTLVESTGKKCEFLRGTVEKLGFGGVKVLNIRAEDGAKDESLREKFDVCCARAVARLNTLAEYCLPFVKVGGRFLAYKSRDDGETEQAMHAIEVLGGEIESELPYSLPEGYGERRIIVIKKRAHTPPKYPRGNGKERKLPL